MRDFFPGAGARLLVTTRWTDWAGWADEMNVDVMPLEAAVAFPLKRTNRTDRDGAGKLAAALGSLPLALDHAGAYVRLTGTSFSRYAERLSDLIGKGAARRDLSGERRGDLRACDRPGGGRMPGGRDAARFPRRARLTASRSTSSTTRSCPRPSATMP